MFKNKLFFKILLNSLLGIVFILIWSKFVNLSEITQILKTVQIKFALAFLGLVALAGMFRGLRFKFLLKDCNIPFKDVVMLYYLCQFLSFMIPIRAGEITKSAYLTTQFNLPFGKTITWVFIDRALDFLLMLLVVAVFLIFIPTNLPPDFIKVVLAVLLGFIIFFVLAIKSEDLLKKFTIFLSNFLILGSIKRLFVSFIHSIIEGLDILKRRPIDLSYLAGLTVAAAICDSLAWLSVFSALGINFGFARSILGNALEAFTFLIPAAPGYVGSAEAAGLAVYSGVMMMEANLASAVVLLFHVLTVATLLILGLASLYFLKLDLKIVWKKLKRE
ncbi:MAG: lysylphosphatidylglycerol synthase transmembrane domain-containing protein [Candidatus Daviesbacteria bacterium]